jgi:hypothetical protein
MALVRGTFILLFLICFTTFAAGQRPVAAAPPAETGDLWPPEIVCPGQFPSDLTQHNCSYPMRQRVDDWVTTSFTDQAISTSSGAALYGTLIHSPSEFPRTLLGFGERLRTSYIGGISNSTTQFLVGSLFKVDQRHVSCGEEQDIGSRARCTAKGAFFYRTWHVIEDTVTARESTNEGNGARIPSPRLLGAFAGAYAQSPWQAAGENTPTAILSRAGTSMITPFLGSLLHEYPSILKTITKPLHLKKKLPPMIKPLGTPQTKSQVQK